MPETNQKDKAWLFGIDFEMNRDIKEIGRIDNSSNQNKGYFQPGAYEILLQNMNQKSIKLKVFCATIIQYGPWVTDLSQVK
jgi:hypothetical protein